MAGALYPVEHLLVHAGTHGTAAGLALLAAEALLAAAIYLGCLTLLAPATGRAIWQAAIAALRRVARRGPAAARPG